MSSLRRVCKSVFIAFISAALLVLNVQPLFAALAQPANDALSRIKTGVAADHEIRFTTPTGIDSPADTMVISLPDFVFGAVDIGDIDLAYGPVTGFENPVTIAAAPGIGIWGVVISGTTITITAPTNAAVGTIPGGDMVGVLIGTNAVGGVHQLTNPAIAMSAQVTIAGTFGDHNVIGVPIVSNDVVAVSAVVLATSTPATTSTPSGGGGSTPVPPVIWNVQAINITSNSVRITWNTDLDSNSVVDYGMTASYASGTAVNASLVTNHSVDITGLSANTVYHFQVTSVTSGGLSKTAGDYAFTTLGDTTAPVISNVRVTNITDTTALVLWDTDEPATTLVTYGTTLAYGSSGSSLGLVTSHSVLLTGLTEGTLYHFFVTSADASLNSASSPDGTFTTTIDTTAPANVIGLTATPGDAQVTLDWTNPPDPDFIGTRIVRKTGGYPTGPFDGTLVYDGSGNTTIDTGVVNGITYYYAAYAYDAHSNFSSGALASATPSAPVVPPPTPTSTPPVPPPTPVVVPPTPPPAPAVTPTPTPAPAPAPTPEPTVTPTPAPSTGLEPVKGALTVYFSGAGGSVPLTPDSGGRIGMLVSSPVNVTVPLTGLGGIPSGATILVGSSLYALTLNADKTSYTSTFVPTTIGQTSALVTVNLQGGTVLQQPFIFNVQSAGVVVEESTLGATAQGVAGTRVQLYKDSSGTWVPYGAPQTTNADGIYAYIVPNGKYYVEADKDGYQQTNTPPFSVTQNVVNDRIAIIKLPVIKPLSPQASIVENAGIIAQNVTAQAKFVTQVTRAIFASPQVQTVNNVAIPTVLTVTVLNVAGSVPFFNFLAYLQYFFTQPILLLGKRRRKQWGVVFNSLSKQPIELVIVRLLDAKTKLVVQSKVSDKYGRYAFIVKPGVYLIEAVKPGHVFPTLYLAGKTEDVGYSDLYHGQELEVKEKSNVVTYNIPLDPIETVETPKKVLWRKSLQVLRNSVAFSGILLGMITLLITPSIVTASLLLAQIGIYLLFRRLAAPSKSRSWGIVFDAATRKPLQGVILRIFDKKFNKLLETQVSDRNGKYGFLVRRNVYYVVAEKPGYQKVVSPDIDLSSQDEAIVDQNLALKTIQ